MFGFGVLGFGMLVTRSKKSADPGGVLDGLEVKPSHPNPAHQAAREGGGEGSPVFHGGRRVCTTWR